MRTNAEKFNKAEKSWILYDWANSVYATNIMAAIFPIYYASVAGDAGDKWWGIGVSVASLLIAVMAPFLGAIGDFRGMKKRLLTFFLLLGVLFTALMAFVGSWQLMLIGYVISHIGYSGANVFYDAFLTDVTTSDRMHKVSAWGYAMGYLGGSTIPFVISIVFLLLTDFSETAIKFSILITSVWWLLFSVPLLKNVRQEHYVDTPPSRLASSAIRNLWSTMKNIARNREILVFLIAYFFYIDGVNTVISLATNYGATLGLGSTGMILALLLTQLVAVPFSILFGRLAKRIGSINMIISSIVIYFIICGVGFFMGQNVEPYQISYVQTVDKAAANPPSFSTSHDQKTWEQLILDIKEEGKDALAAENRMLAFYEEKSDGSTGGVIGNVLARLKDPRNQKYTFSTDRDRLSAISGLEAIKTPLLQFATDEGLQADYRKALALSSTLFWIMAVLVGTVQGGIQALSRSYFGRLIPPQRSNEYFGFFDIFGKFAAVIGPFLYSIFYMLTGRASIGIISLMALFLAGGLTLFIGRNRLRLMEKKASPTSES